MRAAAPALLSATVTLCCASSAAAVVPAVSASASSPAAGPPAVSASASPAELTIGTPLTVSGHIGEGIPAMSTLVLQASPYPYSSFRTLAHTTGAADGSYSFTGIELDRNTRLRVMMQDTPALASAQIPVTVDPLIALNALSLGPGRTRLSIRMHHAAFPPSNPESATWYLAPRGSERFHLSATTLTHELSPAVTYASAIVDPPSDRFAYRVCLNPPWEPAMGSPATHGACPDRDFTLPRAS